jgi:hypothetical protein
MDNSPHNDTTEQAATPPTLQQDQDSDPRTKLRKWFLDNGGYLDPSLSLDFDQESGQHFRATTSITASESSVKPLCKCPFSLSLSFLNILPTPPANIRNHSSTSVCTHLVDKVPQAVRSYFFLCEQRLLGEQSFWAEYIACLPGEEAMTTPWWFDESDLVWLLGTGIHVSPEVERSGVEMRRAMWRSQWADGVKALRDAGVAGVEEKYTW